MKRKPKVRGKTISAVALHFTWDNGYEEFYTDWEEHGVSDMLDEAVTAIEEDLKK